MNNNCSSINYNDCNFHDFSATTRCNYPERDRQTKINSQNLIIPTETEVWQFLQDECKLDISSISIRPPFDKWWNILHEGSHYATKPLSYLTLWRENGSPGEVPNLDLTMAQIALLVSRKSRLQKALDSPEIVPPRL